MTEDEMKDKYKAFIAETSEILGLGKPIDILKLCATTDLFFQPLEKRITELEKENAELKERIKWYSEQICNKECAEVWGELDKAKEIIKDLIRFQPYIDKEMIFHSIGNEWKIAVLKARQFLSSSENLNK